MKKLFTIVLLLLATVSTAKAQRIEWNQVSPNSPPIYQAPGYNQPGTYQGSSGTRYQYDLNNPADRGRYSIDLDAQRRDYLNRPYDAGSTLDTLRGQHGAGVYPR
jgi:hypothetical protein